MVMDSFYPSRLSAALPIMERDGEGFAFAITDFTEKNGLHG
jgi:hypothetical protein